MARYRKKPVVVEVIQFTFDNHESVIEFCKPHVALFDGMAGIYIDTLEGRMLAIEGDWIIRGVQGEVYPCKPDIFAATYEEVTDGD